VKSKVLPKLLYIGDVPVDATLGGAALTYRLLENYPSRRLHIVEGDLWRSKPESRLDGVVYDRFSSGPTRLLTSRFMHPYASFRQFDPEAILTVVHGYSWIAAAALARRFNLPLHLIVHDDWPRGNHLPRLLQEHLDQQFGRIYRQAQSRICISPYMAEHYEKRYQALGTVLYPSRSGEISQPQNPPQVQIEPRRPLVVAYAGSIATPAYEFSLTTVAEILDTLDGALIVYAPVSDALVRRVNLNHRNISFRSVLPWQELIASLRNEADVLFVPMSFEQEDRENMEIAFPSKLADYTATGLPLLIWGPSYCSAVRWAMENPGVAEVVDQLDRTMLAVAIGNLASDTSYRFKLGKRALELGRDFFGHNMNVQKFHKLLRAPQEAPCQEWK
jgi:glycosyltransferase involved in cell wall biosynthesis